MVDQSPSSVLLRDNTNAGAAEVAVRGVEYGPAILFSATSLERASLTT